MHEEKTFNLLSKLLDPSNISEDNACLNAIEAINDSINSDLTAFLQNSKYPHKASVVNDLRQLLDECLFLSNHRMLVGKTIINIYEDKKIETAKYLLNYLSEDLDNQPYTFQKNIPVIIYHSDISTKITAINIHNCLVTLSYSDFIDTITLYKQNIQVNKVLQLYHISAHLKFRNIAIIYFPFFSARNNKYYQILKKMSDIDIHLHEDKNLFFNTFQIIEKANNVSFNYQYSNRALSVLDKIKLYFFENKKMLEEKLESVNTNIINSMDSDNKDQFYKIRTNWIEESKGMEKSLDNLSNSSNKIFNYFKDFEKSLTDATPIYINSDMPYSFSDTVANVKLAIQSIKLQNWKTAREYILDLRNRGFEYSDILEYYLSMMQSNKVNYKHKPLEIRSINTNLLKYLAHPIAYLISEDVFVCNDTKILINILSKSSDAFDNYFVGQYYENVDFDKSKEFFWKSLRLNYKPAGYKLLDYVDKSNKKELSPIAELLVPEANYIYANLLLSENKYISGITNLKIAAALKNIDAIEQLADIYYKQKKFDVAKGLYTYLNMNTSNHSDVILIRERLGVSHYNLEQYQKAFSYFSEAGTCDSYYYMGRMYEFGDGVTLDLKESNKCYKKAINLYDLKGMVSLSELNDRSSKVESKIRRRQTKAEPRSYTPRTTTKTEEGCFITTAACIAVGKSDNCDELQTLRYFRDTFLKFEPNGDRLIGAYYEISPEIVRLINSDNDSHSIYNSIFNDNISKSCSLIREERFPLAKNMLISMFLKLWKRYPELSLKYKLPEVNLDT